MYLCTINSRKTQCSLTTERCCAACIFKFSCRFGQCDSWVFSCGRRWENKDMLLRNKRMDASALCLSADGYEEHGMDGTDSQDYKEVTESLTSFAPAVRNERPAVNRGRLHCWVLLTEIQKFWQIRPRSLEPFLPVFWAVWWASLRWGVSWWSSAALSNSWNT